MSETRQTRAPWRRTAFAQALLDHLQRWRSTDDGSRAPFYAHVTDNLHRSLREVGARALAEDEVRPHDYLASLPSSQAFALNLFLPFRDGDRDALDTLLSDTLGVRMHVDRVVFEWVPPGDLLGEIRGDRPLPDEKATGVDVVLWAQTEAGAPVAILIEVKLGEGGFTHCNGATSPHNHREDVCASASAFFAAPDACYLRRPSHQTRDRRYWEIFTNATGSVASAFPGAAQTGPCPFRTDAQQPMRNHALALALEQSGRVERAWFVLCVHDDNPDVPPRWNAWRALLPADRPAPALRASQVVTAAQHSDGVHYRSWMNERYMLGTR